MASRSLNKVLLIGNLTRDPELKYTPTGTPVCSFGVATNRNWTTNDGQQKEDVQYHRIVAWQKLAELCAKLLTKGKKVYLEGRITYRTFTGKDGQERAVTEIVLDDFIVFNGGGRRTTVEAEETKEISTATKEETKDKDKEESISDESTTEEETEKKDDDQNGQETTDEPKPTEEVEINEEDMPF